MREIIVIGSGSEAKSVLSAAEQAGMKVRAIYDDDPSRWGRSLFGVVIVGPVSNALYAGLPAVLGLDDLRQRKVTVERLDLEWVTVIHPQAFLHPSSVVGPGTVVMQGAVVQPSVVIGRHVILAANVTVAHDCVVKDFACLSTGVDLAGTVHIGEGACLRVGAVVIPNVHVGAWAIVGPRSAVTRDVPDNLYVEGLPARPIVGGPTPGNLQ